MTGINDPTSWNIKRRKISHGIQIYEAKELEKLERYPGFDNYHKITVRDHVSVSQIWRTWGTWANTKNYLLGVILFIYSFF